MQGYTVVIKESLPGGVIVMPKETDYFRKCQIKMVHPWGFEPQTFYSGGRRSIQLSYGCAMAVSVKYKPPLPVCKVIPVKKDVPSMETAERGMPSPDCFLRLPDIYYLRLIVQYLPHSPAVMIRIDNF